MDHTVTARLAAVFRDRAKKNGFMMSKSLYESMWGFRTPASNIDDLEARRGEIVKSEHELAQFESAGEDATLLPYLGMGTQSQKPQKYM